MPAETAPPPSVSVVVPCRNEEATIGELLRALSRQTYPVESIQVVIADGMSTDGTRETIHAEKHGVPVIVVDNPHRNVPSGLNRAIEVAAGDIVIRMDAHAVPADDYVERCVGALVAGRGDNVGGVIDVRPTGRGAIARAIASVVSHPFGAGDAAYRIGGREGSVDTVPFGAFRRETLARIGPFDESLPVNQDYEFNARIREAGGVIWLDPSISCVYYARSNLARLARQYWRYGFWKRRMLARHPGSLRWRQAVPPAFVASLGGLSLAGSRSRTARRLLGVTVGTYLSSATLAGVSLARSRRDPALAAVSPLAFATVHLAWGTGFLVSLLGRKARSADAPCDDERFSKRTRASIADGVS